MTKSVLAVARQALAAAAAALPAYPSRYARRDYTQPQLLALLAVRQFLGLDYRGTAQLARDWPDLRGAVGRARVPDHATLQRAAARLLKGSRPTPPPGATAAAGRGRRLIPPKPRAAADSTGYEARAVSRYFVTRAGRRGRQRHGPKLTAALDTPSHLLPAARATRGPSQDAPHLAPAARAAARDHPIDAPRADAGYDAEANHAAPRGELGVRSTVIPLGRRGTREGPPTEYRRQVVRRFRRKPRGSRHERAYGQRWQVGSGFSRNERPLGTAPRATRWANQEMESLLRGITHNLMLLAAP